MSSLSHEQWLGLFMWLLLKRHDGLIHFTNEEVMTYPGMDTMPLAIEHTDDGFNVFFHGEV